jgi:spore coat polysaccharide biosynthesis protein SpsF (cytidylyltransferase family)
LSRTVIAIQARLGSKRMPRKILADLGGMPMLQYMYNRLKGCKEAFAVVVACPVEDVKAIEQACPGVPVFGGPEEDLLTRLHNCADEYEAYTLVRVTADCPLVCPEMLDHGIQILDKKHNQEIPLVQNWRPRTYPDGFDFDIWRVDFLAKISENMPAAQREYFAQWCLDHELSNSSIQNSMNLSHFRLTVDYPEDLELVRKVVAAMGEEVWGAELIVRYLVTHPEDVEINKHRIDGKFGAQPSDLH